MSEKEQKHIDECALKVASETMLRMLDAEGKIQHLCRCVEDESRLDILEGQVSKLIDAIKKLEGVK